MVSCGAPVCTNRADKNSSNNNISYNNNNVIIAMLRRIQNPGIFKDTIKPYFCHRHTMF